MQPFVHVSVPSRVVFGSGTLERVPDEIRALGCSRALVLSTPQQADAARDLADRLGSLSAGIFAELAWDLGAPTALKDIGMSGSGLDRAADLAVANPYWNPRPIERRAIRALLEDAFDGRRPGAAQAHRSPPHD